MHAVNKICSTDAWVSMFQLDRFLFGPYCSEHARFFDLSSRCPGAQAPIFECQTGPNEVEMYRLIRQPALMHNDHLAGRVSIRTYLNSSSFGTGIDILLIPTQNESYGVERRVVMGSCPEEPYSGVIPPRCTTRPVAERVTGHLFNHKPVKTQRATSASDGPVRMIAIQELALDTLVWIKERVTSDGDSDVCRLPCRK